MKYPEYIEVLQTVLQEEIFTKFESLICKIYGFKDLSFVDQVRKISFLSIYKKHKKSVDLCMLPPCQENLKLHMTRANYVTTTFNRANMFLMSLDSPYNMFGGIYHHCGMILFSK